MTIMEYLCVVGAFAAGIWIGVIIMACCALSGRRDNHSNDEIVSEQVEEVKSCKCGSTRMITKHDKNRGFYIKCRRCSVPVRKQTSRPGNRAME